MANLTVKIIPTNGNKVSFSGNYRIFTMDEPVENPVSIYEILESIDLGSADDAYVKRYIRYSQDGKKNWSLWYAYALEDASPSDVGLSTVYGIPFYPDNDLYLQFKYEYDDTTMDQLREPITINEIKVRLRTRDTSVPLSLLTPKVSCGDEGCPPVIFNRNHTFDPYDVGPAVGLNKELSFYTNRMFGHDVVYFRAQGDEDSLDYIFKEYSLYKVNGMKCIKVMVNENEFPDNKPLFDEIGVNYEGPFEVEIDKRYFESIFGVGAEPRKKDFLYFPLLNRMFEVTGSYWYRGIMMQPMWHKLTLKIFRPNINYIMEEEPRQFLDNVLLDSEKLFEDEVDADTKDATMPQQYKTITDHADETRGGINADLGIRPMDFFFNYASLIENYYDLTTVVPGAFAVDYKQKPVLDADMPNMTFTTLFNLRDGGDMVFLYGRPGDAGSPRPDGIEIGGTYNMNAKRLTVKVGINEGASTATTKNISPSAWYAMVVSISREFGQVGVFIYGFEKDPNDAQNHTNVPMVYQKTLELEKSVTVDVNDTYRLLGGPLFMANIRLFNKTLREEDHMFILSQLFIKDESMLYFIDNNRPRLNVPYISRNR